MTERVAEGVAQPRADVVLITMPFAPHVSPSIGLSLLQASLRREGICSRTLYFSLSFAEIVGHALYTSIATDSDNPGTRELVGEWLFRETLFEPDAANTEAYIEEILRKRAGWPAHARKKPLPKATIRRIVRIRDLIPSFMSRCADEVLALQPKLVGFTSSFQQHVASLGLAKEIKRRAPDTFIVFGGANTEGVQGAEIARQFAFVDAVVSGEADLIFTHLVRSVLNGLPAAGLTGIRTRTTVDEELRRGHFSNAPMVMEMDALPVPDYSDFFERFEASPLARTIIPGIFFESSRGCWWGERAHCTFCGLNGLSMKYRSKSAARALEELRGLSSLYPGCSIFVTDAILNLKYFDDFIPALAREKLPTQLFYETKSNLKKHQVSALRDAEVTGIQPGIESLDDSVLKLMRKGVTALQNIQLLKWCKEFGIKPEWNFLWGFPGEEPAAYAQMARLVPQLRHLPPPAYLGGIHLDRFSPNFDQWEALGFANVRPLAPYRFIYPFEPKVVANLAYFFDFDHRVSRSADYATQVLKELRSWKTADANEELLAFDNGTYLSIWDLRRGTLSALTTLSGLDRFLYLECDEVQDVRALTAAAHRRGYADATESSVADRLAPLVERHVTIQDGARYLALAIKVGEYQPSKEVLNLLRRAARWARRPSRASAPVRQAQAAAALPAGGGYEVKTVAKQAGS